MKIQIKYDFKPDLSSPCIAGTYLCGKYFCELGKTYGEAKSKLLARIKEIGVDVSQPVPEPEEVEVEMKS